MEKNFLAVTGKEFVKTKLTQKFILWLLKESGGRVGVIFVENIIFRKKKDTNGNCPPVYQLNGKLRYCD